jgi:tetratricopeptide (TPR) repeat protein
MLAIRSVKIAFLILMESVTLSSADPLYDRAYKTCVAPAPNTPPREWLEACNYTISTGVNGAGLDDSRNKAHFVASFWSQAQAYTQLKEYQNAIASWTKYFEMEQQYWTAKGVDYIAYISRAKIYRILGLTRDALSDLQKAEDADAQQFGTFGCADIAEIRGDVAMEKKDYGSALKLYENSSKCRGSFYITSGPLKDKITNAERAIRTQSVPMTEAPVSNPIPKGQ